MSFEHVRDWRGTAEGLTSELKSQIDRLELAIDPPALRTVRLWIDRNNFSLNQREQNLGFGKF